MPSPSPHCQSPRRKRRKAIPTDTRIPVPVGVWCGVVWCGAVRCCVVWCGCGVVVGVGGVGVGCWGVWCVCASPQPPFPPAPSGNPLWGSRAPPWTDVTMTVIARYRALGFVGQLTRGWPTRDGQQLPKECHPPLDPARCPGKTPGKLTASPARPPTRVGWLLSSPAHHRGECCCCCC